MANIFIIDDDKQLLHLMGMMLRRGNHEAHVFDNPDEGYNALLEQKPDLLVLDVMMPGASGHVICRRIRASEELADLPVLILTARAQDVDRDAALKSGADDYMSKPVTAEELLERIDGLLNSQPRRSRAATIVSLFGLRGGIGRTTLAVNLAIALRQETESDVCLVDLSPSGGQAALHLRLNTRTNWSDLPTGGALAWEILAKRLLRHDSGVQLLAAPPAPQSPDAPSPELVTAVLQVLHANVNFTIIDLPPVFSPPVIAALQASHIVLHTILPEVVSVQMAIQSNHVLAGLKPALQQKVYLQNQTVPEPQLPITAVERALGARLVFKVGYDNRQARALAQGTPLAGNVAQSPLTTAVSRLAKAIEKQAEQAAR